MNRGVEGGVPDARPGGDSDVGSADDGGLVAELIADPLARDVAGWVAGRTRSPVVVTGIGLGLGFVSALWFSEPGPLPRTVAAVALLASFVAGRAGRVLAVGAAPAAGWLAAMCSTAAEYAVYAGLAASDGVTAGPGGVPWVWRLAVATMVLLTVRRTTGWCAHRPAPPVNRLRHVGSPAARRVARSLALPAGERAVVVAVLGAAVGPRITFLTLLGWGAVAFGFLLAGRIGRGRDGTGDIAAFRDDGPLARWLGGLVDGRLPPLPPALVGVFVTTALAVAGMRNLTGILMLTPVEAMLLAGLGRGHPHDGRLDWLVPPLLQTGEYVYLCAVTFGRAVPPPLVFTLAAMVALRNLDVGWRAMLRVAWPTRPAIQPAGPRRAGAERDTPTPGERASITDAEKPTGGADAAVTRRERASRFGAVRRAVRGIATAGAAFTAGIFHGVRAVWDVLTGRPVPSAADVPAAMGSWEDDEGRWVGATAPTPTETRNWGGLGWDLRMLIVGVAAVFGGVTVGCVVLSGYLPLLVGGDYLTGWLGIGQGGDR